MPSLYEVDCIVKGIDISWTTWGKMRGEKLVSGDVSFVKSGTGKGFERIFSVNIADSQTFRVQQMIDCIKAGSMPDSILITPHTKPGDLADILSRSGFTIDNADPCMMLYLDRYEEKESEHSDFDISLVKDRTRLADWLRIVNAALFGCELVTLEQFHDILKLDNTTFYLGLHGGRPVTACMTIAEGDTAVLEMVATLEEYRRKGFATAVIGRVLTDLRNEGIKTISLRAEADGVGVYQKLGFRECFKRVVAVYNGVRAE